MKYHKIQTIFKRDMSQPKRPLIYGDWTKPEFEYLANNDWLWTEKVDGTNIRIYWESGAVRIEGRNENSQIPSTLLNLINTQIAPAIICADLPDGTVLYGEGCGQGIQKGKGFYTNDTGVNFILFDMASIHGTYYPWADVVGMAKTLNIRHAPEVGMGSLFDSIELVRKGMKSELGNGASEGLVLRPLVEMYNRWGERVICKIKTIDFANMVGG